ncbi:Alpha/Beta hydrolase protein [Aspergillus similis]
MAVQVISVLTAEGGSPLAKEVFIPTRDGANLATDVYLPPSSDGHRLSAILVRTPYDKSSRYTSLKYEAVYYNNRGYAFIAQDVRGKHRSTGETVPYIYDVDDAYDTVEWITQQSWSNGRVGVTGVSYYGFTTWAAVASGHPAIKAAVPQATAVDMGAQHAASQWARDIPSLSSVNDLIQIWTNNNGYLAAIDWAADSAQKVVEKAGQVIGENIAVLKMLNERIHDQGWFNPYGDRHPYHTTEIPVLHWQNWYDPGLAPAGMRDWRYFRTLPNRDLHYLRANSADHSAFLLEDIGDPSKIAYLNDEARERRIAQECGEVADFFDEFVNGVKPAVPRKRARWHLGHVGWQDSTEYPPPCTPVEFTLSSTKLEIGYKLMMDAEPSPSPDATLSWIHDPNNPVPSSFDLEALWYLLAAYPDERELAERDDVLTFRTEPLVKNLDFCGQPTLQLHLGFHGPSTHLMVKLQDVYPDGTTRPISFGRRVLDMRTGPQICLALDDNAYRVQVGHRLQLQIQSSDFPIFLVHPGTDENPWIASRKEKRVHVGGALGATLRLPMITSSTDRNSQSG